jgi:dCTP diphosphatase
MVKASNTRAAVSKKAELSAAAKKPTKIVSSSKAVASASKHLETSFTNVGGFDSLEAVRAAQQRWVDERDWSQFHTPRNLILALTGEVGELAECLQWKGDSADVGAGLPGLKPSEREAFEDELADVFAYVVRLAAVSRVDLPAAWARKHQKNTAKYPAKLVKGSSAKYTEYKKASRAAK